MKVKIVNGDEIRLLKAEQPTVEMIRIFIKEKWPSLGEYLLRYIDEDGDNVVFDTDDELAEVLVGDKIKIFIKESEKKSMSPPRKRALEEADDATRKKAKLASGPPKSQTLAKGGFVYPPPEWSGVPTEAFWFECVSNGVASQFGMSDRPFFIVGRSSDSDLVLNHQYCSRKHAIIQFNDKGECFLYDLDSRHGTYINNDRLISKIYSRVYVGDRVVFGRSQQAYFLQGNPEFARPDPEQTAQEALEAGMKNSQADADKNSGEKASEKKEAPAQKTEPAKAQEKTEPPKKEPNFIEKLKKKHLKAQLKSLPFGMNAPIERILSFASNLDESQRKQCNNYRNKKSKLKKLEKKIDAVARKGEKLGSLEALHQQRDNLENQIDGLEDSIRASVFKEEIATIKAQKKKTNANLDARRFDDSDDFYDRAKVIKKRRKVTVKTNHASLPDLQKQLEELEKKLAEQDTDEETKKKLSSELRQVKSQMLQIRMKSGAKLEKLCTRTVVKNVSLAKSVPTPLISFGALVEPLPMMKQNKNAVLEDDSDGFKKPLKKCSTPFHGKVSGDKGASSGTSPEE